VTITVADVRARVTTGADDDAVQSAIDAAYEAIADEAGAPGERTEQHSRLHGPLLMLDHPAEDVARVIERADTSRPLLLSGDDWLLRSTGSVLERLRTGTNPCRAWQGRVDVVYSIGDTRERDRVAMALVELDFQYLPGTSGERIGDWLEQKNLQAGKYDDERTAILATLDEGMGVL
jgi:hypothetical protein